MEKIDKAWPNIQFEKLPLVLKRYPKELSKELEAKNRKRALNARLLQVYREQINPSAKVILWTKIKVHNFPPNLSTKNYLDMLESCLPKVLFESLEQPKQANILAKASKIEGASYSSRKHILEDLAPTSEAHTSKFQRQALDIASPVETDYWTGQLYSPS